jgi:hypothetical protein
MMKALLVHGALWGEAGDEIGRIFSAEGAGATRAIRTRFLGYGEANPSRSLAGEDNRALAIACNELADGEGHEYSFPLPPILSGRRIRRRLIATLAWLTPINVRHKDYRSAALYLDLPESRMFLENPPQVDDDTSSRGTVQHRVLTGEVAAPVQDGDALIIKVNCRSAAGRLPNPIPYGLAVTLEVAEPVAINIYDEIRDRIRPRAAITPRRA